MKFIRLTSVFLCCALLSSFLILSASAADDDNYYSLPSVGLDPSLAIEWPVNPVAGEYNSILGSIARQLGDISSQINGVQKNQVTIAQILSDISGIVTNNGKSLGRIETSLSSFESILTAIFDKVASETTLSAISGKVATESTLNSFFNAFQHIGSLNSEYPNDGAPFTDLSLASYIRSAFAFTTNPAQPSFDTKLGKGFYYHSYAYALDNYSSGGSGWFSWSGLMSSVLASLVYDGRLSSAVGGNPTLFHYVRRLGDVLASDEDFAMREDQKENVDQVKKDFITGQSGKTSLGKDDFGSLSSVGGTFKDTISLNGQSSLSDLTSGLADADTAGQGWFSQATKDSLDVVSGSGSSESTVSTFSDDGLYSVDVDPDPYHMEGFENNYAWLWGDD